MSIINTRIEMKKILHLTFVCSVLFNFTLKSQDNLIDKSNKIKEIVEKAYELNRFSGCVLVTKGENKIFEGAYGFSDIEQKKFNSLDTKFNVASITKTFTAVCIMLLVKEKKINLDDPVIKYLDNFPLGDQITIYNLLTHTAGFGDYEEDPEYLKKMFEIDEISEITNIIYKSSLLIKTPGIKRIYSNSGAIILGAIIEKVSGEKYSEFLTNKILIPLGMRNSKHSNRLIDDNIAKGYVYEYYGRFRETSDLVIPPSSATGLQTTVNDLLKFSDALFQNSLLDSTTRNIMLKEYIPEESDEMSYGCFWEIRKVGNYTAFGHAGRQVGYNSRFYKYLDSNYTIIILSNLDYGAEAIFSKIEAVLLNHDYKLPGITADRFLYSMIKEKGIEFVEININNILNSNNYQIIYSSSLNNVGYQLIEQKDYQMAVNIFRLNVKLFPDDANVYDSLAEAYMILGNSNEALINYERAYNLDNKNLNALNKIKELKEKR